MNPEMKAHFTQVETPSKKQKQKQKQKQKTYAVLSSFLFLQYLSPARPNGIAVHDITATTESHWSDGTDGFNLTVAMEIIPTSCDYDLPLINITLLNESAPGDGTVAKCDNS